MNLSYTQNSKIKFLIGRAAWTGIAFAAVGCLGAFAILGSPCATSADTTETSADATRAAGQTTDPLASLLDVSFAPTASSADDPMATMDAAGQTTSSSSGILPIPDYTGDIWTRSYLLGDLGGLRTQFADDGFQFGVSFTQYFQSVVSGGLSKSSDYGGLIDYTASLDLDRAGLVPGGLVTFMAQTRYGTTVNGDTGSILPVNTTGFFPLTSPLDQNIPIAVEDLYYTQFFCPYFAAFAGKLDTLSGDPNAFASGRGETQFMNSNFVFNSVVALRFPYSTLGAGVILLPIKNIEVKSMVFQTQDSSTSSGFNNFNAGGTWVTEADTQYRIFHLLGGMNLGGLYSFNQNFFRIGGEFIFKPGVGLVAPTSTDTWALYWSGWQYLYEAQPDKTPISAVNGPPSNRGIGLFARAGLADNTTNPVQYSLSGGVGGKGMIPTRDNDTFGVGYFYNQLQAGRLTTFLGVANYSNGFEAYYDVAVTPATHLTFDVQADNSVWPNTSTAVTLGVRLNLNF